MKHKYKVIFKEGESEIRQCTGCGLVYFVGNRRRAPMWSKLGINTYEKKDLPGCVLADKIDLKKYRTHIDGFFDL